jgi:hypothetical protein
MAYSSRAIAALVSMLVAVVALPMGCARRIGDGCSLDTDCSINNDRRCDTSQVGGYCTVAECDRNSCPDDSLCVEFFSSVPQRARRFCMSPCATDGDCRGGYKCQQADVAGIAAACPANASTEAGCTRLVDDRTGPGTNRTRVGYCALPISTR